MFLGHYEIIKRIENGNLLENIDEANIQGAGVDIRIDKLYSLKTSGFIGKTERELPEIEKLDNFVIKPKVFYLFKTLERINMPSDLVAFMFPRSTLFRCGISLRTAVIDPGYKGELTVGLFNESEREVTLERHARVAQLVFARVKGETKLYNGRYQDGKIR
ncbi:MAG: dCTP deaminase [Candidatus Hydrothermarchaeales archaeon]